MPNPHTWYMNITIWNIVKVCYWYNIVFIFCGLNHCYTLTQPYVMENMQVLKHDITTHINEEVKASLLIVRLKLGVKAYVETNVEANVETNVDVKVKTNVDNNVEPNQETNEETIEDNSDEDTIMENTIDEMMKRMVDQSNKLPCFQRGVSSNRGTQGVGYPYNCMC